MLPARITEKIKLDEKGCWLWEGPRSRDGYGRMTWRGSTRFAHRIIYELLRSAIPSGLELDHLCRVRCCVNPDHLEPKTHRANMLAPGSAAVVARNAAKTHCPRGHELVGDNLDRYQARSGGRKCRKCKNEWHKKYQRRRRAIKCAKFGAAGSQIVSAPCSDGEKLHKSAVVTP